MATKHNFIQDIQNLIKNLLTRTFSCKVMKLCVLPTHIDFKASVDYKPFSMDSLYNHQ